MKDCGAPVAGSIASEIGMYGAIVVVVVATVGVGAVDVVVSGGSEVEGTTEESSSCGEDVTGESSDVVTGTAVAADGVSPTDPLQAARRIALARAAPK